MSPRKRDGRERGRSTKREWETEWERRREGNKESWREWDRHTKREVCIFKNIDYIAVFTTRSDWNGLSTHCFKRFPDISSEDDTSNLDLLWNIFWPLKSTMEWDDAGAAKWTVDFYLLLLFFCCCFLLLFFFGGGGGVVHMLDLNPGDMSCGFSTLKFIASQAEKNKVTPIMTFDRPLIFESTHCY